MSENGHPYVVLARRTTELYLRGEPLPSPSDISDDASIWQRRAACFVSIKTTDGDLRGCIGTILPTQENIGREIIANAISASTRDPRFPPMKPGELEGVVFSVDVLSLPEPVSDRSQLDPGLWGVIVSSGHRRGVLLPDLEGVDSVEDQLDIASRKAGIGAGDPISIERFNVVRYREEG